MKSKKWWPLLGIPWTLFLMYRMHPFFMADGIDFHAVIFFLGPFFSLLLVFAVFRVGAIGGLIVLAIATYFALNSGRHDMGDMKDAPMAFAWLFVLVGGPLCLLAGIAGAMGRRSPPKAD